MQDMHYLPLSAMAEPREQQQSSLHQLPFKTFALAATAVSGENPTMSKVSFKDELQDLRGEGSANGVLSRDMAESSIETYIECCQVTCPYINTAAFRTVSTRVCSRDLRSSAALEDVPTPEEKMTVNLGIATGILLGGARPYKSSLAASLARKALDDMPKVLDISTNTAMVRCLISLAVHSMYSPLCGSTWHIVGLAAAKAFSAGLHTDGVSNWHSDDTLKQVNCQLFWGLYVLDG